MDSACRQTMLQKSQRPSFFVEEGEGYIPVTIIGADNKEILPEDIGVPPDGGWGWVVVFAAFMTNIILGSTFGTFGLLLEAIIDSTNKRDPPIDISVSTLGSVSGTLNACSLFAGPLAAAVVNKMGFRITAIIGSLISSFGFAAAWFFSRDGVPDIPLLILFYGLVGGLGLAFIEIPKIISIGFYFERKRALATGIAGCGGGVGMFLFPPIMASIISKLDWYGMILIQAGLTLSYAIFAILYRPVDNTQSSLGKVAEENLNRSLEDITRISESLRARPKLTKEKAVDLTGIEDDDVAETSFNMETRKPTQDMPEKEVKPRNKFIRLQSVGYINARRSSMSTAMTNLPKRRISLALQAPQNSCTPDARPAKILRVSSKRAFNKPMSRDNIFFKGSIDHTKELAQDFNIMDLTFANSTWDDEILDQSASPERRVKLNWREKLKSKLYIVQKMLDLGLLKSPTFILVCLSCGFCLFGLLASFVYLIGLAQEKGCSQDQAAYLLSIIGISDILGRIICGGIANLAADHLIFINNSGFLLGGLATLLVPFAHSYPIFVIYACVFGFTCAAATALRSSIIVKLLGLSNLTNAFGLTMFFEGMASLLGTPFIGYLRDSTGTYEAGFYFSGASFLLAGVLLLPVHMVNNWERKRNEIKKNES